MTCWQQRIDPDTEVSVNKKKKQRPVSIAGGEAEAVNLKKSASSGGGLKKVPSLGSLQQLDGVNYSSHTPCRFSCYSFADFRDEP